MMSNRGESNAVSEEMVNAQAKDFVNCLHSHLRLPHTHRKVLQMGTADGEKEGEDGEEGRESADLSIAR